MSEQAELGVAIASVERRFGTRVLGYGDRVEGAKEGRSVLTGTAFDALSGGGIHSGAPLAFIGSGTSGKLSLSMCAVAGAQRDGGYALWLDPTASFDPGRAVRSGVDLERLIVIRARACEAVLLAAGAALRGNGFRLVVVDTGSALAPSLVSVDQLAPLLSFVRGSTAALLVITDRAPARLAIPSYVFDLVQWTTSFKRTSGWAFAVSGGRGAVAVFRVDALGRSLDRGTSGDSAREAAS